MSIQISLNDELKTVAADLTVAQLLAENDFNAEKIAVAINTNFVPRSQYADTVVNDGDCLDVLSPVQGG